MNHKLYVGNLSYQFRDDDLRQQFLAYGAVQSAKIMTDRETDRSKGFGFVEMGSDTEAEAAIRGLNGKSIDGRNLVVNVARPREDRPMQGRSGSFGGGMHHNRNH